MNFVSIPYERVKELVSYDPDTGLFTRLVNDGRKKAGSVIGRPKGPNKYVSINLEGRAFRAHRIAWLLMTGAWPNWVIDHRNGDMSDNRWSNLRDVSHSENAMNRRKANISNKSSGLLGSYWSKADQCWRAQIKVNGKPKLLGRFKTPEAAHEAYVKAKRIYHPTCTI